MATITLNPLLQIPFGSVRFQRNYLWSVLLPDMPGTDSIGVSKLIQSITFGDYSIEIPTVQRIGSFNASFAGLLTVQNMQLTILKTSPDIVSEYLNAWKLLIVDAQGLFQPKDSYQRNIYVRFIDTNGSSFAQYKFIGAFPTKFPQYTDLSYESSTITRINTLFSVDKIEYETL